MKDGWRGLQVADTEKLERDRTRDWGNEDGSQGEGKMWAEKGREWAVLYQLCHFLLCDLGQVTQPFWAFRLKDGSLTYRLR